MKGVWVTGLFVGVSVFGLASLSACSSQQQDTEAALAVDVEEETITEPGVQGGVNTQTVKMTAQVAAIDSKNRTFTLEDGQGARRTFTAGPEAVNFNQIKKGDQVTVEYMQETVVYLREKGEQADDGVAGVAASAPAGSKPAGVVAGTIEVSAEVIAVDLEHHTATLQFADGSNRVFPVRKDVKLEQNQVGREVVMQITTAVAVEVSKL